MNTSEGASGQKCTGVLCAEGMEQGLAQGMEQGQEEMLIRFLKNGGTEEQARRLLQATEEQLAQARKKL